MKPACGIAAAHALLPVLILCGFVSVAYYGLTNEIVPRAQAHASHLREACSEVIQALSPEVLVGVVGAGVAGAGREVEGEPVFSLLAGELPEGTSLRPFLWTGDSMPRCFSRRAAPSGDRSG